MLSARLKARSIPNEISEALESLVNRLREELGDVKVYLFGSYAKGTWLEDSDVDLIVVSPSFEGMEQEERYRLVRLSAAKEIAFELLVYTPKEFEEVLRRSVVLQDAAEHWIELS